MGRESIRGGLTRGCVREDTRYSEVPKAGRSASPAYVAGRFARAQRRSRGEGSAVVASAPACRRPLTLKEAAERAGVTAATLRRWASDRADPGDEGQVGGDLDELGAAAHARIVARLRERGHSLEEIREATEQGPAGLRLRRGHVSRAQRGTHTVDGGGEGHRPRARADRAVLDARWACPGQTLESLTDEDVQALQYAASVLSSGFPLVAFLQLARVYGQALAQIADAEVRLFHIYVHEPLMREGVPGMQMAEEMEHLARDLLPLTSPLMDYVHQRFLQHYIEQDVVGHMEVEMDEDIDLGRLRVAIAFCDLAGYTRYTEEEGEEEALSFVERFVEAVTNTLPDDARVIKTIGDEVMIVGQDVQALTDWAVGFQHLFRRAARAAHRDPLRRRRSTATATTTAAR